MKKKVVAAQLSTVHSQQEMLDPGRVRNYVENIIKYVPLDIIIAGWEEKPGLFQDLCSKEQRLSDEVFLWYPFLSDFPGSEPSHMVVNMYDESGIGWAGYEGTGIHESFKQACPNNPSTVSVSLSHMERLLTQYDFDGVFIDKIRFPSMANGLRDVLTCFCPSCYQRAAQAGLDLNEVKYHLQNRWNKQTNGSEITIPSGADWLEILLNEQPVLQQFLRFRADSINRVVATIAERVTGLGKKLALDVFSPGLAPLVGQDFMALDRYADWVKPMIYRFGNGPSSLRSEIPALVRELGGFLGLNEGQAMHWCNTHVKGLEGACLSDIEKAPPLSLLQEETAKTLSLFPQTPVYLGLETVFIQGQLEVKPQHVEEILRIGEACGVQGFVISWDIYHTPVENVIPLKSLRR